MINIISNKPKKNIDVNDKYFVTLNLKLCIRSILLVNFSWHSCLTEKSNWEI